MNSKGSEVILEPDIEVNHYLHLYRMMRDFHVLPNQGGVLEQDAETMFILEYIDQFLRELRNA